MNKINETNPKAGPVCDDGKCGSPADNPSSKGQQMIACLSKQLGIENNESEISRPQKRVRTHEVIETREFDPGNDSFKMTTHMVKIISHVTECFKDNIIANLKFNMNGIDIFGLYHSKTVCISTHLGKDLFTDFSCEKEVYTSLNLMVFSKKIASLQKFKIQQLTFETKNEDLMLIGHTDGEPPASIKLKSLTTECEELDLNGFSYDVLIRLQSSEFSKQIDCMPSGGFTIHIDTKHGCLVFTGDDDHSTTELKMKLDKEVIDNIKLYPAVTNYRAAFVKANIGAITKGAKLSEFVIVGFSQDAPLFVRYVLNESSNLNPEHNSSVSMYFSPKLNDELEFEHY